MSDTLVGFDRDAHSGRSPNLALLAAAVAVALASIADPSGGSRHLILAGLLVAGVAWLVLAVDQPVTALIAWLFVAANLVPGLDLLTIRLPGPFRYDDSLILLLAIAAASRSFGRGLRLLAAVPRWLAILAFVTIAWWAFTLIRTRTVEGVSLFDGAAYGRDLIYAVVVAVLCCLMLADSDARDLRRLIVGVVGVACFFAVAHALTVLGVARMTFVIHPYLDFSAFYEYSRLYSTGQVLLLPALSLSAWFALGTTGKKRMAWSLSFLLLAADTALQFTRANYLAALVALCVGLAIVVLGRAYSAMRGTAIAAAFIVVLLVAVWSLALAESPSLESSLAASSNLYARVLSIGNDLGLGATGREGGTVAARQRLADGMLKLLGDDWPWGLGFLNPQARYFSQFPQGSIRNTDLGALSALMVTGALGVTLAFLLPMLASLWLLSAPQQRPPNLAAPGLVGYAAALLAGSVTLVTLFSIDQAPIAGLVLGIAVVAGGQARRQGWMLRQSG